MTQRKDFLPYHRPQIGIEEIDEVVATLRSGWLTTGERTARFEREFEQYTGSECALAVNSCTAALHLSLAACDVGPGDEVITTPMTFCATVNCILHVGATPVLADIDQSGNIDPQSIAARITPRTKAILPVHLAGLPCNMDAIWTLAREHGLLVIEDAAHALGTHYKGHHLGSSLAESQSDMVAYSFYATKNVTTGEGGMVTTNDPVRSARMRRLALHGISKDAWNRYAENGSWHYEVVESGFKYNLSDLQSAVGIHQLRKVEKFISIRKELVDLYRKELAGVCEVELPCDTEDGRHSWHLFVLRLRQEELAINRDEFIKELRVRQIGTSVHFIPVPMHPFFKPWAKRPENQCPRALALYERIVSLPLYPGMTAADVSYVASSVKDIVVHNRRGSMVAASEAS